MSVVEQNNTDPFGFSGYTRLCPVIPMGWGTGEGDGERTGPDVQCCRRGGVPHHTSIAAWVPSTEVMWVTTWALQAFLL